MTPVLRTDPSQFNMFFPYFTLPCKDPFPASTETIYFLTQRLWNWWYWKYSVMQYQYDTCLLYIVTEKNYHQTTNISSYLGIFSVHILSRSGHTILFLWYLWWYWRIGSLGELEIAPVTARLDLVYSFILYMSWTPFYMTLQELFPGNWSCKNKLGRR